MSRNEQGVWGQGSGPCQGEHSEEGRRATLPILPTIYSSSSWAKQPAKQRILSLLSPGTFIGNQSFNSSKNLVN